MGPEHARGGRDLLVQCYAPADLEASGKTSDFIMLKICFLSTTRIAGLSNFGTISRMVFASLKDTFAHSTPITEAGLADYSFIGKQISIWISVSACCFSLLPLLFRLGFLKTGQTLRYSGHYCH